MFNSLKKMYYWALKALIMLFGWVYLLTLQVFFDVVFNAFHLVKQVLTGGHKRWRTKRREYLHNIKSKNKRDASIYIQELLEKGKYQFKGFINKDKSTLGKWPTWTACSFVLLAQKERYNAPFYGNCQDAVSMAKWLIKKYKKYHKEKVKYRICIYVPVLMLDKIHYILEVNNNKIVSGDFNGWKVLPWTKTAFIKNRIETKFARGAVWLKGF